MNYLYRSARQLTAGLSDCYIRLANKVSQIWPPRCVYIRPVPGTRPMNRVPGSVLPVLLPESEILWRDKQDRQEDLPLETAKHFVRYALPTKLSRCNDNASPSLLGLRHRLRNRVRLCQDWQLLCLPLNFRVPGYPTITGIGYPVPKISVNARA